jgi:serine/threonine protein kinase
VIGNIVDETYRVVQLVGDGGFGVVYECQELDLDRSVALKMMKPEVTAEKDLRRFLAEAKNLASLNHPNVVQIYRFGTYDDRPYIAMEFVRGETLWDYAHRESLTIRRVLELMRQVAAGLAAIHSMDIVHRDVSPLNIMVTANGTVKILDLGLSRDMTAISSMNSNHQLTGTLPYVSPEQIGERGATMRSEIFSFAVILYEMLAGQHPFHAEHQVSLIYNIAHRDPEPLEAHLQSCPKELSELVRQCLQKDPKERPASMADVAKKLDYILGLPVLSSTSRTVIITSAEPRATPRNPYLNRVMIKHPADFFGRSQEVKRIFARLNATPPGSISIVGERKIGKSSVLNHVYSRRSRQAFLEDPDATVMVFLDLQEEKGMSMQSFVGTLLGIANYELRGRLDVSDCALSLDGVKDLVQRLDGANYRLAILLDEFEGVTTNPNFSLEFFSFLRFLANHYNVAYLTSSARDLQVLCHTKEISDSPFFNIFSTMRLGVFERSEAEELIRVPSERVGRPLAPFSERILEMTGLFPFFIQMACSHAIEYLDEHPQAKEPDFDEIRRRFYDEARLHFRYVWDGMDTHERSTLVRVAQGRNIPDALRHVLTELEARHYVQGAPRPKLFADTFDEYVREEANRQRKPSLLDRMLGRSASS